MIFGGRHDQDQDRYSTWEEAEAGHAAMCKRAFSSPQNKLTGVLRKLVRRLRGI
jgi:hypothetical protein